MNFAVVFFGTQTALHSAYFAKHGYKVHQAPSGLTPFDAHKAFPGHDFLLCWNACVVPIPTAYDLRPVLNLSKINVTWDSYGRNYPHKSPRHWSLDLIGIPATRQVASYELLETQDLHILPKDVNVQDGYLESSTAQFRNIRSSVPSEAPASTFVKHYDPKSGRYL